MLSLLIDNVWVKNKLLILFDKFLLTLTPVISVLFINKLPEIPKSPIISNVLLGVLVFTPTLLLIPSVNNKLLLNELSTLKLALIPSSLTTISAFFPLLKFSLPIENRLCIELLSVGLVPDKTLNWTTEDLCEIPFSTDVFTALTSISA